jgi:hypothetical protein
MNDCGNMLQVEKESEPADSIFYRKDGQKGTNYT